MRPSVTAIVVVGAGLVSIQQLPEGSSVVECDAVGDVVVWRDGGLVSYEFHAGSRLSA